MTDVTASTPAPAAAAGRVVSGEAVLDLTYVTGPEDLAGIAAIEDVAVVIVPEEHRAALRRIPMDDVALVVPVPAGGRAHVHTGSVLLGGQVTAGEDDVLVVTGALAFTEPVTEIGFGAVHVTGMVLAPYGSEAVLAGKLGRMSGSVLPYRYVEGQRIRQLSGETRLTGAAFANTGGTPDDVLLLAGVTVVTSPVTEVGYQSIVCGGVLTAPVASEAALLPALTVAGVVGWYSGEPRLLPGDQTYGRAFFELLERPRLLIVGDARIDDDVTAEVLQQHVAGITLVGDLVAPRALVPIVQFLVDEQYGDVLVAEDLPEDLPRADAR